MSEVEGYNMNHPNREDLNEDKIIAVDTQDQWMQMVVELKLQNEYLKSCFQDLKNVHTDSAGCLQETRATGENGTCEDSKDLHEKIESLNRELVTERQTRGAAEAALERLRAEFLEAYAKSQELAEAQKNMEQLIKECDRSNTTRDQISELPEYIVHRILSFLDSPADLVRSSVLSKKWFTLTASFPILDFDMYKFIKAIEASGIPKYIYKDNIYKDNTYQANDLKYDEDNGYVRDRFFKYVGDTTSRFCNQDLSAHTFSLTTWLQEPTERDIIDRCIRLILGKGVQVFHIHIINELPDGLDSLRYCVPEIVSSAPSLTSLKILGGVPYSLADDVVKFKSLKILHLHDDCVNEKLIKNLITSCPLLEDIDLFLSDSCTRLCLNGLHNLHKLVIESNHELEIIDIEAPNLCYLYLIYWGSSGPASMNLASCKKLTTVAFQGSWSQWFGDFISNFPFVEILFFHASYSCKILKLSSPSLRTLIVLHSGHALKHIDINTPNLLLFEYHNQSNSDTSHLVRDSAPSEALMECYLKFYYDETLLFRNLRKFLEKKKEFIVLKLHVSCVGYLSVHVDEQPKLQSPAYELERVELELELTYEIWKYETIVENVLRCFRPRSLALISNFYYAYFEGFERVVKFTYGKLLQQEDQSQTNIHVVVSSSSKGQHHFSDLNSLLKTFPYGPLRAPGQTVITFTKEELPKKKII